LSYPPEKIKKYPSSSPTIMNLELKKTITLCSAITLSHLLVSCGLLPSNDNSNLGENTTLLINTIDQSAITYRAKYGLDYEIQGNVIAKYPHFDLTLFSRKSLPSNKEAVYVYELTSKDGFMKIHICCDPASPEKKHFYLEDLHFYYHSNSNGTINIYMPDQLIAQR
jgi:hypothetical protein